MCTRAFFVLLYWLFVVLCPSLDNIVEGLPTNTRAGAEFLIKYGYMRRSTVGQAQDMSQSLRAFQRFAGLNETGSLDDETVKLMQTPRCGDEDPIDDARRKRRFALQGSKWEKKMNRGCHIVARTFLPHCDIIRASIKQLVSEAEHLTYRIVNDPYSGPTSKDHMSQERILKTVQAALQKWSHVSQLTFTHKTEGEADIMIKFLRGNHNDNYAFDGRGGSLAHAFYPQSNKGIAGDAHFDVDEKFSLSEPESTNFVWVTTHEFGHSLGLRHSDVKEAIMYPWYTSGRMADVKLRSDDRKAIQRLYGKPPKGRKREPKIVLPFPPREECKMSFTAVFHDKHRKKVFAFKDYEYYVLNRHGESKGPKKVRKHWNGMDLKVVAAYTRNDGLTVFFTELRYAIYSGTRLVKKPDYIYKYGLPSDLRNMDAAFVFPGNGKTYFFKGDKYWRYNERKRKIDDGYPKLIEDYWRGVPNNIDAAFQSPEGGMYIFKGAQFYKLHQNSLSVFPTYPKPIGPHWLGCSDVNVLARRNGGNSSLGSTASKFLMLISVLWVTLLK